MLLEAAQQGSLEEVLTVASALSVQDPRERPVERQQACGSLPALRFFSVAAINSLALIPSAAAIFSIKGSVGTCSPRSILPMCERDIPA